MSRLGCEGDRQSMAFPSSLGPTADKPRGHPEAAEPQVSVHRVARLSALLPGDRRGQALVGPGTSAGKRQSGCRVSRPTAARGSSSAQGQGVRWAPLLRISSLRAFQRKKENPGLGWVRRSLSRSSRPSSPQGAGTSSSRSGCSEPHLT